ncbi:alpha/beta fold hydrolase [Pseudooceanicola sp. MF1-13]|uniref:alpha/beta fold hydrolase n=1 Tax=Pseudooceanicola sp. MF1-13 TaxID=3379095 RepID=UPI003891C9C1
MIETACLSKTSGPFGRDGVYADIIAPSDTDFAKTHVMVHGGMHSGVCWLRTPDNREGWAIRLARGGDRVICVDWPGCGRSGYVPPEKLTGQLVADQIAAAVETLEGEIILWTHSMGGAIGWRIAELLADRLSHLIAIAPGPPGNIQPTAKLLSQGPDRLTLELAGVPLDVHPNAPVVLSHEAARAKLIGSSTQFPRQHTESYLAGLQAVPRQLFLERINFEGQQLRMSTPNALAGTRVLIVTGDSDPDHPPAADSAIGDFLTEQGMISRFVYLPEHDITGNGHMMMLEQNSDQILDLIAVLINETQKTNTATHSHR